MIELVRLQEWSSYLSTYMKIATQREFAWGSFDCALNAADAVNVLTGVDLAADFRGTYSDEAGAYAALKERGYSDTVDLASQILPKADSIYHGFNGDLAGFKYGDHHIVGLIYQGRIFSPSPGKRGMGNVSISKAHTVFKVGEA